jgi:hypothetical protein
LPIFLKDVSYTTYKSSNRVIVCDIRPNTSTVKANHNPELYMDAQVYINIIFYGYSVIIGWTILVILISLIYGLGLHLPGY